jgi:Pentapeptide repeats (8 copies)
LGNEVEYEMSAGLNLRNPAVLTAIGVIATLVLSVVVVMVLLRTGGAKAVSENAALIGALVALGGVFTAQMVSIALDDRRAQEARELEAQRAHDTALQNYFEQVGTLLIEQPLRRASPGDNLSTVVRAQTLTVLKGLDPHLKRILLQFLYESGLIHKDKPVVHLIAANLSGADLSEAYLVQAALSGTALSGADLSKAYLNEAYLMRANMMRANLRGARGITGEELEKQAFTLKGATMPDGSKHP